MRLQVASLKPGLVLAVCAQAGVAGATLQALVRMGAVLWPYAAGIALSLVVANAGAYLVYRHFLELQESSRRLSLLAEMNVQVNRDILLNEDIDHIYRTILNYLFRVFNLASTGSILILDDQGYLHFAACRGFTQEFIDNFHLRLEDSFLYQLTGGDIREARLFTPADFERLETVFKPPTWEYRSVISAPLFVGDRLFGLLNLDSEVSGTYGPQDVTVVERFRSQIEIGLLARERYSSDIKRYQLDSLTGLLTRRYFEDLFKVSLERAARHKEGFVIALFDADGLKTINDTFGHPAGDQMLLTISNALRASCRTSDIIGRLGGDEFVAAYHLADMAAMDKSIAAIRERLLAQPARFGETEHPISFSYGLARFPDDGGDLDALMASADKRLYAMKAQTR